MIVKTVFHMALVFFQAMSSFRTFQTKNQSTIFLTDDYTSTVKMALAHVQTSSVQTQQQKAKKNHAISLSLSPTGILSIAPSTRSHI